MRGIKRGLSFLITISAICFATGALAAEAYTTATIWLRTGPDSNFPRIELVPRNSFIDVYGCTDGYSWCDVDYEGERGWLPATRLQFVYNGQRGSINNLAPFLGLMILEFSFHDYWSNHYQDRSWYNNRNIQRWQNWQTPRPQHRLQQAPPTPSPLQSPLMPPLTPPAGDQPATPQHQPSPSPLLVNPKLAPKQQAPSQLTPAPQTPAPQMPLQQAPELQAPSQKEAPPKPAEQQPHQQPRLKQNTPQQPQTNPPLSGEGKGRPKKKCVPPEACEP